MAISRAKKESLAAGYTEQLAAAEHAFLIGFKCPLAVSMSLKINLSRQLSTGVKATNKDKRKKGVLYEWRQREVLDLLEI